MNEALTKRKRSDCIILNGLMHKFYHKELLTYDETEWLFCVALDWLEPFYWQLHAQGELPWEDDDQDSGSTPDE